MGDGTDSGKVLDIKTADIKLTAPVFHTQGKNLSTALTTLVTTLDGLGSPWGDDEQGKAFGDAYRPQQKAIEKAAGILVLGLVSIHEAMADMADGHVDNDDLIAGMFTKVRAESGEGHDKGAK
ncbi:hypothetical protein HET69_03930 [Streptomyces sp. CJ_13]|uniref:hypothetical protein n=1 Tax=Streptomyces TaxID=1883 RepID=UPI000F3A8602|nr:MULTISPECIES: hypothetical protein [unclassified Streptomyces]AYV30703.1 hypothetical protein EES41_28665 [Streptomyces sp. ADI95-16]MBT1183182.1 hypothetical protein [Streptomyces sp. CJ_13]